jgi:hypothetical protein
MFYYHNRVKDKHNNKKIVSTVAFCERDGKFHRGISAVHPNDNGCKATGRTIAAARLEGAIAAQRDVAPVLPRKGANMPGEWECKGQYDVELTEYEQRIYDANTQKKPVLEAAMDEA